jgi:hypothetical protein
MNSRRLCALLAVPAAAVLSACTSSSSHPQNTPSTGNSIPSGVPTTAPALSAQVRSAVAGITSAHISLDINLSAQALTGEGDEKLENGQLVALDITENLPGGGGSIRIITVGGKTYAKLPAALNSSGKPYLLVTPTSSNAVVKQLAASLDTALSSASLGTVSVFVGAAKSIDVVGTATVAGVSTTHYSVTVDIKKLPKSLPGRSELAAGELDTIPMELYVDSQGRPVEVADIFRVQGEQVASKATVTGFNRAVTITAPPANQVGT